MQQLSFVCRPTWIPMLEYFGCFPVSLQHLWVNEKNKVWDEGNRRENKMALEGIEMGVNLVSKLCYDMKIYCHSCAFRFRCSLFFSLQWRVLSYRPMVLGMPQILELTWSWSWRKHAIAVSLSSTAPSVHLAMSLTIMLLGGSVLETGKAWGKVVLFRWWKCREMKFCY